MTLARSTVTFAEVLVTSALDTPSSFKSAACTFGGHPDAHLRPVRVSDTVSVLTSSAAVLLNEATLVWAVAVIPNVEQERIPAIIILCILFIVVLVQRFQCKLLFPIM